MPEPRRDQWGRYLLPDPHTGEERGWTRATTWAATVDDTFNITDWKMRNVAKGIAVRDDLRLLAVALDPEDDKKELGRVSRDALEAAGGGEGRNIGTALHTFTAQADMGQRPKVPEPWDRDLDAYRASLVAHGIVTYPLMVERIVCVPELGVAGTFDRLVQWPPDYYVADVKTGDVSYSWPSIAIQLALYAHAEFVWNVDGQVWETMPTVNLNDGLVIHLPEREGRCDLYLVDLKAGWAAAQLCADVRDWRKRKDLHRPIGTEMLGRSPVQPVLDLAGSPPAEPAEDPPAQQQGQGKAPSEVRHDVAPVPGTPAPAGGQETPEDAPPIPIVDEPAGPPPQGVRT